MAKTKGGLSASPSSPTPRPQQSTMGGAASPPVQDPAIPPSEGGTPSQRRCPTRRPPTEPVPPTDQAKRPASRPPAKRTKFLGPGEPSHAPQAEPPTEDSRIPVGIPLETVIRRPMIAGPPIEGNLDCRDRSFHSETYFDIEALRQQSAPSEPLVPDEETIPAEQPISEEEIRAEPSHDPTTI
ncbi:lysine-rich arabinogalactan protein 19-like [Vitis vinifera]|uniref:lysine-rich arabinogalactan protein 19-like n=1 Tax=Vitis vinifera TaxID=29760 RepID=UPI0028833058|nr:lysine-rich arabinogalactan protein 19-like [Vitis vinifera]